MIPGLEDDEENAPAAQQIAAPADDDDDEAIKGVHWQTKVQIKCFSVFFILRSKIT